MDLKNVRFKRYKNIWKRIGDFLSGDTIASWAVWLSFIFVPIVACVSLFVLLEEEISNSKDKQKSAIYSHKIAIFRTNGVVDTLLYHDNDSCVSIDMNNVTDLHLGKNLGFTINNNMTFENVEKYEIIK